MFSTSSCKDIRDKVKKEILKQVNNRLNHYQGWYFIILPYYVRTENISIAVFFKE